MHRYARGEYAHFTFLPGMFTEYFPLDKLTSTFRMRSSRMQGRYGIMPSQDENERLRITGVKYLLIVKMKPYALLTGA